MSPRLPHGHVSEFIRTLYAELEPNATLEELQRAQESLDDVLDVINQIHDRRTQEKAEWNRTKKCFIPFKMHTRRVPPKTWR